MSQKSVCADCGAKKSVLVKEYQPDKKKKNFHKLKSMYIYCENCKKHTSNTFPKIFLLISKNKIKAKSKYVICLTERTLIHEIEDKDELEIYLQFFTD